MGGALPPAGNESADAPAPYSFLSLDPSTPSDSPALWTTFFRNVYWVSTSWSAIFSAESTICSAWDGLSLASVLSTVSVKLRTALDRGLLPFLDLREDLVGQLY